MRGVSRSAVGIAVVVLAGCAALRERPQVHTFRLEYPPASPSGATLPVTIRVTPFGIASAYDDLSFIYRTAAHDVGVDPYNRWVANPASMITDLVARDLAASRSVQAVLQEATTVPYEYELTGHIEALEERDEAGGCGAHLRLRFVLIRVPAHAARAAALQDVVTADIPCEPAVARSYAEAMSQAVQQVSDAIRVAVVDAIAADRNALEGAAPSAPVRRGG